MAKEKNFGFGSDKNSNTEFNNLKKELEDIKRTIGNITKNEISNFSSENISNVKDIASEIIDDLSSFLGDKKDDLTQFFKKRKKDFFETRDKCEDQIKSHPFFCILGAIAVGTLLGIVIKK